MLVLNSIVVTATLPNRSKQLFQALFLLQYSVLYYVNVKTEVVLFGSITQQVRSAGLPALPFSRWRHRRWNGHIADLQSA